MPQSIPRKLAQQLIFGGLAAGDKTVEEGCDELDQARPQVGGRGISAYLEVFQDTLRTVIESEPHLISQKEAALIEHYASMSYDVRYCLARLVLRKPGQWHPVSALQKYTDEIGENRLEDCLDELCRPIPISPKSSPTSSQGPVDSSIKTEPLPTSCPPIKSEDSCSTLKSEDPERDTPFDTSSTREIVDLTLDSEDEDIKPSTMFRRPMQPPQFQNAEAGPSNATHANISNDPIKDILEYNPDDADLGFFCEDETVMSLPEILGRLNKEHLISLAKVTKCKITASANKESLIRVLLRTAGSQQTLNFSTSTNKSKKGKGKAPPDGLYQTRLPFGTSNPQSQLDRLRQMALQHLGKCIRVNTHFFRLVRRLHIACFRETEHPTAILLPALLSRFRKRNFTKYLHTRTGYIFPTRRDLLDYEKALELETVVDEMLDASQDNNQAVSCTPGPTWGKIPTPQLCTPLKASKSADNAGTQGTPRTPYTTNNAGDDIFWAAQDIPVEEKPKSAKLLRLAKVKECLEDCILPQWQEIMGIRNIVDTAGRTPGLERFETGYVYTRIVGKALSVYGPLKEYQRELEILRTLIAQNHWRRGKRAVWYDRCGVLYGHLAREKKDPDEKRVIFSQSLNYLKAALFDEEIGLVLRPKLVRRIGGLEQKLRLPPDECLKCDGELKETADVFISRIKVPPPLIDTNGRIISKENTPNRSLKDYILVESKDGPGGESTEPSRKKLGKSSWVGRGNQIVNVETVALESYEDQGFKGFHSETRILTMIFALLFWDIIFLEIPGAFETPFQTAPLDLFEDTFYYARKDFIDVRIEAIEQGQGPQILEMHDDRYRPSKTWCVGVRWDLCEKADLIDIVQCIGGRPLSIICRLFCEDYAGRGSGVPDLIVWNTERGVCKFVEVKGPGDTLQENQRLWVDSLLGAGAAVEICHVRDQNQNQTPKAPSSKKRKPKGSATARHAKSNSEEPEVDYDQLDKHLDDEDELPTIQEQPSASKRRRTS